MRMEEATTARRVVAAPATASERAARAAAPSVGSTIVGLAVFTMMAPFFLNPPLFVTIMLMQRGR